MSESGATPSLDIQRLRTDKAYWNEQTDAGNVSSDLIRQGVVPVGFSGNPEEPYYLNSGPNPIPVTGTTLPGTNPDADPSLGRFGRFNADGQCKVQDN